MLNYGNDCFLKNELFEVAPSKKYLNPKRSVFERPQKNRFGIGESYCFCMWKSLENKGANAYGRKDEIDVKY